MGLGKNCIRNYLKEPKQEGIGYVFRYVRNRSSAYAPVTCACYRMCFARVENISISLDNKWKVSCSGCNLTI